MTNMSTSRQAETADFAHGGAPEVPTFEPDWLTSSAELPDLTSLRLLCVIAHCGSIGRAGKQLGIAQPSASQRLRQLERRTGIPLVERTFRGCVLTAEGRRVVAEAEVLLDAADKFRSSVELLRLTAQGKLSLAASCVVAEFLLPGWITRLRDVQPDLSISLKMCNSAAVARELERSTIDLGFIEGPDTPDDLVEVPVATDELKVVVGAAHQLYGRPRVCIDQLLESRLITRELGSGTRDTLELALDHHGVSLPPGVLELGSTSAIRSAVVQGAGVGILSTLAIEELVASGAIWVMNVPGLRMHRTLRAVYRAGSVLSHPARELLVIATST
ncbi:MAG: LysR family transcriptional regulator [Streptosporangiales bacterium]|nr:LysR family transcriptional regulator [Streptosporangiales bacterium]